MVMVMRGIGILTNWTIFGQYFGLGRELGRGGDVSERVAMVTWKQLDLKYHCCMTFLAAPLARVR